MKTKVTTRQQEFEKQQLQILNISGITQNDQKRLFSSWFPNRELQIDQDLFKDARANNQSGPTKQNISKCNDSNNNDNNNKIDRRTEYQRNGFSGGQWLI